MSEKAKVVILFDEPICVAVIDSHMARRVQKHGDGLRNPGPPGCAKEKQSKAMWIWQILPFSDRLFDLVSADDRVGLIKSLKKLLRKDLSSATNQRKRGERNLYGHDGRPLPVPQPIRGDCRKAHEAQTTGGESRGDDD
jgi:hypothetical protein